MRARQRARDKQFDRVASKCPPLADWISEVPCTEFLPMTTTRIDTGHFQRCVRLHYTGAPDLPPRPLAAYTASFYRSTLFKDHPVVKP